MNLARLMALAGKLDEYAVDYPYSGWIAAAVILAFWIFM